MHPHLRNSWVVVSLDSDLPASNEPGRRLSKDHMQITFGKHRGKSSQEIAIKDGAYVKWVFDQNASGPPLGILQVELKRLTKHLDTKPFTGKCSNHGCTRKVCRLSAYTNNESDLYPWCAICDPYSLGANSGKLSIVVTYKDMLNHVEFRCGDTKSGYDRIIRAYASSKGLPSRVGAATAAQFFL
jgi:hypothetical protein